jgi:uncharacterized membrane protein YfcA
MDWLYPLSGFVVGAIVGLTGMGGGSLMTPLLILLFGVHPLTAVGTDLLYAAVTKTAGTAIHSNGALVATCRYAALAVVARAAVVSAWSRSAMMSAAVSSPIDSRIRPAKAVIPCRQ